MLEKDFEEIAQKAVDRLFAEWDSAVAAHIASPTRESAIAVRKAARDFFRFDFIDYRSLQEVLDETESHMRGDIPLVVKKKGRPRKGAWP